MSCLIHQPINGGSHKTGESSSPPSTESRKHAGNRRAEFPRNDASKTLNPDGRQVPQTLNRLKIVQPTSYGTVKMGSIANVCFQSVTQVVFDPSLHTFSLVENTLSEVFERYWRWHGGKDEIVSWKAYARQIAYSIKVTVSVDFNDHDPLAVPISLILPHHQIWRSLLRKFTRPS
jgi:hypothetical protein